MRQVLCQWGDIANVVVAEDFAVAVHAHSAVHLLVLSAQSAVLPMFYPRCPVLNLRLPIRINEILSSEINMGSTLP